MTGETSELSPSALSSGHDGLSPASDILPPIHDSDHIFRFVLQESPDRSVAVQKYLQSGAEAAHLLRAMISTFRSLEAPFSLLDFAAGYGRVSRHIRTDLPAASLMSSDIHPEAVVFLDSLGIDAHQSSTAPESFHIMRKFDVIFALSFFTHIPKATWRSWLHALLRHLEPGGRLIFTTHGIHGMRVMGEAHNRTLTFDRDGFWFEPMSEQADIDTAEYGATGTSFRFVSNQIEACGAHLFYFQERLAGYQDIYIVRKQTPGDH